MEGNGGVDVASYEGASKGVTVNLADGDRNSGDAKGDRLFGIENLLGSSHVDRLVGDAGANALIGGLAADSLTGGAGADAFVFVTRAAGTDFADRITDFVTDVDEIRLDDLVFTGLALGDLDGGAFRANNSGQAQDGTDRVIYEKDTGWLRWDADGNGGAGAKAFAQLSVGLNLGADDFLVI
jgi:serralysin